MEKSLKTESLGAARSAQGALTKPSMLTSERSRGLPGVRLRPPVKTPLFIPFFFNIIPLRAARRVPLFRFFIRCDLTPAFSMRYAVGIESEPNVDRVANKGPAHGWWDAAPSAQFA